MNFFKIKTLYIELTHACNQHCKHWYSLVYGFVAVRPNGDMSFSCNMGNPFLFGKAYESIKIPIDKNIALLV